MNSLHLDPETYYSVLPDCEVGEVIELNITKPDGSTAQLQGTVSAADESSGLDMEIHAVESTAPAKPKQKPTMSRAASAVFEG